MCPLSCRLCHLEACSSSIESLKIYFDDSEDLQLGVKKVVEETEKDGVRTVGELNEVYLEDSRAAFFCGECACGRGCPVMSALDKDA